jgi:hypothetical protein
MKHASPEDHACQGPGGLIGIQVGEFLALRCDMYSQHELGEHENNE